MHMLILGDFNVYLQWFNSFYSKASIQRIHVTSAIKNIFNHTAQIKEPCYFVCYRELYVSIYESVLYTKATIIYSDKDDIRETSFNCSFFGSAVGIKYKLMRCEPFLLN